LLEVRTQLDDDGPAIEDVLICLGEAHSHNGSVYRG
jgi:hypothetical protein